MSDEDKCAIKRDLDWDELNLQQMVGRLHQVVKQQALILERVQVDVHRLKRHQHHALTGELMAPISLEDVEPLGYYGRNDKWF